MVADPTPEELRRLATEAADFTVLYVRRNKYGRWVRDAKFITAAGSVDNAADLFDIGMAGAEIQVCAVLRGQVRTVDDFEFAEGPDPRVQPYEGLLADYNFGEGPDVPFTVFGAWDTGDGPRRYSKRDWAYNAEHAELLARDELTEGEVLIAAVVEGHAQVEDVDMAWATLDGLAPAAAPEPRRRRWLPLALACAVVLILVAAFAVACN